MVLIIDYIIYDFKSGLDYGHFNNLLVDNSLLASLGSALSAGVTAVDKKLNLDGDIVYFKQLSVEGFKINIYSFNGFVYAQSDNDLLSMIINDGKVNSMIFLKSDYHSVPIDELVSSEIITYLLINDLEFDSVIADKAAYFAGKPFGKVNFARFVDVNDYPVGLKDVFNKSVKLYYDLDFNKKRLSPSSFFYAIESNLDYVNQVHNYFNKLVNLVGDWSWDFFKSLFTVLVNNNLLGDSLLIDYLRAVISELSFNNPSFVESRLSDVFYSFSYYDFKSLKKGFSYNSINEFF